MTSAQTRPDPADGPNGPSIAPPARGPVPTSGGLASLRRFAVLLRPIGARLVLGLLCAIAASLAALAIPQLLALLINESFVPGVGIGVVLVAAGAVAGLGVVEAGLLVLRRLFSVDPSTRIEQAMRVRLFSSLQRLPIAFHDRWESGQLLSRAMTDLGLIRRWVAFGVIMLVADVVMIGVGLALMWRSHWLLALVYSLGAIPLIALVAHFSVRFQRLSRLGQDQAGDLATNVEQAVHGIRVLKAFGRAEHALDRFTGLAAGVRDTEVRRGRLVATFDSVIALLPELALGAALLVGLRLVVDGGMSIGELSAFFATAMLLSIPVTMLGQMIGAAIAAVTALDRHFEVVIDDASAAERAADPAIDERSVIDPADGLRLEPAAVRGRLDFDGVRFAYPDADAGDEVLRGATLRVEPGETMALVGVTGSGKSTMLQLVPRLYDPTAGAVRIDGHDVRAIALDDLRRIVAIAFEDATLFSGSVRDNVLLGADDLAPDDAEELLRVALDTADAGFADELPEGLSTRIGEEGLSLSGGQRQRLALARAIAARPRVLLLDDPLSALDTATEERVTGRLRDVLRGTTTLVVAHRTSTVALADRVALLDDGEVVAVGTHAELMARDPRYRFVMADLQAERLDLERLADETGPIALGELLDARLADGADADDGDADDRRAAADRTAADRAAAAADPRQADEAGPAHPAADRREEERP